MQRIIAIFLLISFGLSQSVLAHPKRLLQELQDQINTSGHQRAPDLIQILKQAFDAQQSFTQMPQ